MTRIVYILNICFFCFVFCFVHIDAVANEKVDSLIKVFDEKKRSTPKSAYKHAIDISDYYYRKDAAKALEWVYKANELVLQYGSIHEQIELKILIAVYQFNNHQYGKSVKTAEIADNLLLSNPHDSLRMALLYRLAEGYEYTGRPEQGMETYKMCYDLAEKLNDKYMLGNLDIKLGNINKVSDEFWRAISYYKKARARFDMNHPKEYITFHKVNYDLMRLMVTQIEVSSPAERNQLCDSLSIYEEAFGKMSNGRFDFDLYGDLGLRCILLNNDQAEVNAIPLLTVQEIKDNTGSFQSFFGRYVLFGQIAIKQNELDLAKNYIDAVWKEAETADNMVMKISALEMEQEIFTIKKDYKQLTETLSQLYDLRSKLFNSKRMSSVDKFESKLEKELIAKEKQFEIDLINKDKENLATRNFYFSISSIGFAFLSLYAGIFFYIAQRRYKIIRKQNEQLEQLNITKDHIFAIIGHDLRKPALSFRGITKKVNYLIDKGELNTLKRLGQHIEKDAFALNRLTDNLLSWALTEKDVLPHHPRTVDLAEVVEDTLAVLRGMAKDKSIKLRSDIDTELPALVDPNAIRTIVLNILDNAIKYTEREGDIWVTGSNKNESASITISDNGVGITAEKLTHLFDLKKGKSEDGTSGEKGTGLGLHLVKELVKINNGSIKVKSELGKGSHFELTFPIR